MWLFSATGASRLSCTTWHGQHQLLLPIAVLPPLFSPAAGNCQFVLASFPSLIAIIRNASSVSLRSCKHMSALCSSWEEQIAHAAAEVIQIAGRMLLKTCKQMRACKLLKRYSACVMGATPCLCCRIIDTLPKQWGRAPAAGYLDQLQDKQTYHQILLTTLDDIQLMHVLDPAALR